MIYWPRLCQDTYDFPIKLQNTIIEKELLAISWFSIAYVHLIDTVCNLNAIGRLLAFL